MDLTNMCFYLCHIVHAWREQKPTQVFTWYGPSYHVECQSTADSNMVIRMIEYDFAIALEQALSAGSQSYSGAELVSRNLLLLIPYYLMRYESSLSQIAADDMQTAKLVAECAKLRAGLEERTLETGDTILYEQLVELIIRVSDYMLAAYETLRKKVRRAMGGEVLELWRERAERLAKEALEQGIEQGRDEGITGLSECLKQRGVDEALINEAVTSLKAESHQQ